MDHSWRLLAEQPAFDPAVPLLEQLRPFVVGRLTTVGRVILLDPSIPPGHNWLSVYEITDGEHHRFLSWISDTRPAMMRYYIPAPTGTGFGRSTSRANCRGRSRSRNGATVPRFSVASIVSKQRRHASPTAAFRGAGCVDSATATRPCGSRVGNGLPDFGITSRTTTFGHRQSSGNSLRRARREAR